MLKSRVARAEWEARLRELGCTPAEGIPKRQTGEFWRYPKQGQYPFFVSYDDGGWMDGWALVRLLRDIKGEGAN